MSPDEKSTAPVLDVVGLRKSFGSLEVLKGIDLRIAEGEVLAVIGPSGSGKSTMIRCLNMLEVPTSGTVAYRGRSICHSFASKRGAVGYGELRRHVGMVFQHFNLFPHKSVLQNIVEGPVVVLGQPFEEARERAFALLDQVGLRDKAAAFPNHLSGGQKQRVAIARALAMQPDALLLDEVTSALDPELVGEVLAVIRDLASHGMTMAIVTHEMAFAADVASRVVFMDGGAIAADGTPQDVLMKPRLDRLQSFLARFHG